MRKCWKLPTGEIITTPTRFAEELGVSRQNVYLWIDRGLPVVQADDGKIAVLYNEALKWLREQKELGNIRLDSIPVSSKSLSEDEILKKVLELIAMGAGAFVVYQVLKTFLKK